MKRLAANRPRMASTRETGDAERAAHQVLVTVQHPVEGAIEAGVNRFGETHRPEPDVAAPAARPMAGTAFRKREQNSGITVIATTIGGQHRQAKDRASAENKNLLTPNSSVTGKKSTTPTSVAASTAILTSAPPASAAASGDDPISR